MNKSTNRHMNIFDSYTQSGNLPIENNISRGLAILLQEKPSLLMIFLSKINEQLKNQAEQISLPHADYIVDFQKRADDFDYVSTIVGVTLTAEQIECVDVDDVNAKEQKYITDISILYDDTLVFIEVKRTGENCRKQLKEQIDKYKKSQSKNGEKISDYIVDFTWTDIVELLREHKKMFDGNHGRLCDDYLSFLVSKFPSWAPIEHLYALSCDDEQAIYSRLEQIKEEYCKEDHHYELIYGRAAIRLDEDYVSECNLGYERAFQTMQGIEPCITIGMWPSNTGRQYWCFRDKMNHDFFDKRYLSLDIAPKPVCIRIKPYVKFSHYGRSIIDLHVKDGEQNHIKEWIDFANKITGRKKRDKWEALKSEIKTNQVLFSEKAINDFEKEFEINFQNNKTQVDVSCGFEVKAYIPFSEAQKLDNNSVFAELLKSYLEKMKKTMVTEQ